MSKPHPGQLCTAARGQPVGVPGLTGTPTALDVSVALGRISPQMTAGHVYRESPWARQCREGHHQRLSHERDGATEIESIRDNFERQLIRNDAESRIVELDIAALLDSDTVDMAKVEGKIREAAKLRADLRIARLRAIEQANALLSAEQKKKLQELAPAPRPPRPARGNANPTE